MKLSYIVKNEKYESIRHILKEHFNISERLLLKLKTNQKIYINDIQASINTPINIGDIVDVYIDFEEESPNIVPTKMDLDILYEDDFLLIINKPAGIAIHPSCNHFETSLSNGVKYYFDTIGLKKKIRIVNRLDKDTSGIVIFAKNQYIQECLVRQMKNNTFCKEYIAVLDGVLEKKSGTINAPIAREKDSIIKRRISDNGDTAISHYNALKSNFNMSMVSFVIETGRTHQIRVHSKYIGHPIIGDTLYGELSDLINRQALHAYKISFIHPVEKNTIEITAKIPADIEELINNI